MKNKKILKLTIKKEWFNKIVSGEKKEEFREIKKYWISRLCDNGSAISTTWDKVFKFVPRLYEEVHFKNGYSKDSPSIKMECLGIELQKEICCPLGQSDFFVIQLGKILEIRR